MFGCEVYAISEPGALVPPTADEDPYLPSARIRVLDRERTVHLRTYGDADDPPLFIMHGGPGGDFRLLLPLKALSDRYFVVMWDQRGGGLSERVPKRELAPAGFVEELAVLKEVYAPERKISIIAHSFGASIAIWFAATHPSLVKQLVAIEPGMLTSEGRENYEGGVPGLLEPAAHAFLWSNEYLSPLDHEQADYKLMIGLRAAQRNFYCDGEEPEEEPIWRFGAYSLGVVPPKVDELGDRFSFADGIGDFPEEILLIAGTCGAAGAAQQRQYNLGEFERVRFETIERAGHISLFTRYSTPLLSLIRSYLDEYD